MTTMTPASTPSTFGWRPGKKTAATTVAILLATGAAAPAVGALQSPQAAVAPAGLPQITREPKTLPQAQFLNIFHDIDSLGTPNNQLSPNETTGMLNYIGNEMIANQAVLKVFGNLDFLASPARARIQELDDWYFAYLDLDNDAHKAPVYIEPNYVTSQVMTYANSDGSRYITHEEAAAALEGIKARNAGATGGTVWDKMNRHSSESVARFLANALKAEDRIDTWA